MHSELLPVLKKLPHNKLARSVELDPVLVLPSRRFDQITIIPPTGVPLLAPDMNVLALELARDRLIPVR